MIRIRTKQYIIQFFLVVFFLVYLGYHSNIYSYHLLPQYKQLQTRMEEGDRLFRSGSFSQALEEFKLGLEIARAVGDIHREIECLKKQGLIYWNRGQMAESLHSYSQAFSQARKNRLLDEEANIKIILDIFDSYTKGKEFRARGKHEQSIDQFMKAILFSRKIKSREHELKCCRQLSVTYLALFCLEDFYQNNYHALELAKELNHLREEGKCLLNIGLYYQKTEDYSNAFINYGKALDIAVDLKNIIDQSACFNNIGILYRRIGNFSRSLEYLKRALSLDTELDNKSYVAQDLNNIGTTFRQKSEQIGDESFMKNALDYYFESLQIARTVQDTKTEIEVLNNIGVVYAALEDFNRALKNFRIAASRIEEYLYPEARCMILNNIASVNFGMNMYSEAEKLYKQAIEMGLTLGLDYILWEAYYGLGLCYEYQLKTVQAKESYLTSLKYIDRIRSHIPIESFKAGFTRDKIKVSESLINLLYISGANSDPEFINHEIFHIVEKAKARAFLESLGESRLDLVRQLSPESDREERRITSEISYCIQQLSDPGITQEQRKSLTNQLNEAEEKYLLLLSRIRNENPNVMNLVSPEPLPLKRVQSDLLDNRSAIIEYLLGDKVSYGIVITKDRAHIFSLPSRDIIRDSLRAYLKILSDPPKGNFGGTLASLRLYRSLLKPVEEFLKPTIDHLIIVPDGILYYLPFETLIASSDKDSKESPYLVELFEISYVPSCSSLDFLIERKTSPNSSPRILALGNPELNNMSVKDRSSPRPWSYIENFYTEQGFDLSPLPFSRKEAKNVVRFFPRKNRSIALGDQASEDFIKKISLTDYQVLHFACHGLLDEYFPFRSALVLSRGNKSNEDGFLQVREIYRLKMNAELIVLSACQTGKGKLEQGEGVLGLPRIFFYTGAQSVLTSLWKIYDKSTSIFMNLFYRYLFQGCSKVQALRKAKLKMIKSRFSHPHYWAAFILNGEFATSLVPRE